jgi:hypothetical protein
MRREITERLRDQHSGQALVMVGIMMMTLIGFVALATDTGLIWMNRRSLQNSADAAALAGVQQLPAGVAGARATACAFAGTKNGVPDMIINCAGTDIQIYQTYAPNDTIKVKVHKTVRPIFGRVLGWDDVDVGATATALIGGVASACIFPLAQTPDLLQASGVWDGSGIILNKATVMKNGPSGEPLGLQVYDASSKSDWRIVVGSGAGCDGSQDTTATTSPGAFNGPLDQGMTDRKALWDAQGNCPSNDATTYLRSDGQLWKFPLGTPNNILLTPETCYRMVKIPVLDAKSADLGGAATWNIKGFAVFYIANWCGQHSTPKQTSSGCTAPSPPLATSTLQKSEMWGYYVGLLAAGGTDYTGYTGFGTKVAVLID